MFLHLLQLTISVKYLQLLSEIFVINVATISMYSCVYKTVDTICPDDKMQPFISVSFKTCMGFKMNFMYFFICT